MTIIDFVCCSFMAGFFVGEFIGMIKREKYKKIRIIILEEVHPNQSCINQNKKIDALIKSIKGEVKK